MQKFKLVANPGSAIDEAVGASMEKALCNLLTDIADEFGCYYLNSGVRKTKSGQKAKKLLMSDNSGTEYDIDGVIANESMQPLILFESKYIRYKKHNRDKGSWICHAHSSVRRRYHSVRNSIAVLAGNWSGSSQAMMRSNDINLFLVPFDHICEIMEGMNIKYDWGEKEKEVAKQAWYVFNSLNEKEKESIGIKMIEIIRKPLGKLIKEILDDSIKREISKVSVELISNLGEIKIYNFETVDQALNFLEQDELERLFLISDSVTLFDPPPQFD